MPTERRTSEILQEIIDAPDYGSLSLGQFVAMLGDRAFALAILMLALPNSLPIPGIPGFSTLTGIPILLIGWQMAMGREFIWLPRRLSEKRFSHSGLVRLLNKAMPKLRWLERHLMPRMVWVCSRRAERLIGLLFVALACIIALPIPGGNFLPALAMALIALGLLEKDGLFVLCASGFAVLSIVLMYKFIAVFVKTLVNQLF